MNLHILDYFRREWKRLHDEFEHVLHHGVLPPDSPGNSPLAPGDSQLVISDPPSGLSPNKPSENSGIQQGPVANNPYVDYLKKYGDDLWAVQKGENLTIDKADYQMALIAGFTKNPAFEEAWLKPRADELSPPSTFDAKKTTLTAADIGGLFEPNFGTTQYIITGPLKLFLVVDSQEVLTERATLKVGNDPEKDAGVNGTAAELDNNTYLVVVRSNVTKGRVRLQVQARS